MIKRLADSLQKNSDRSAFCINDQYFSYRTLSARIRAIQDALIAQVTSDNKIVAIICNDDIDTYASILAVLISGFTYIPISPNSPEERNNSILKEAGVKLILNSTTNSGPVWSDKQQIITGSLPDNQMPISIADPDPDNNAYILYTSGSTGVPKGVPISYLNISSFVDSYDSLGLNIEPDDRCLQMFELTFDVSVACIILPLLRGAIIFTVPSNVIKYVYILKLLQEYKLTYITIVPSVISLMKPYWTRLKIESVRVCILTAEASNVDLINGFKVMVPFARIINLYGPTEGTIWCTCYEFTLSDCKQYNGMMAIGKPFKNVHALILDNDTNQVTHDSKGELLISGSQITIGYINRPENNLRSFINIELDGVVHRYYKTGDLCYIDKSGDIHYCGRLDNQVQVQGFRVELSEIEVNIRDRFKINNVVVAVQNKVNALELIVFKEDSSIQFEEIKEYLKSRLPAYMIPLKCISISEFPLNQSGKIDKVKLKQLV